MGFVCHLNQIKVDRAWFDGALVSLIRIRCGIKIVV